MSEITVETLRTMAKQLKGAKSYAKDGFITLPMRDDIRLTVGGSVLIPGFTYVHPKTFIDIAGQEAYDYLLTLPRVVCEYDFEGTEL